MGAPFLLPLLFKVHPVMKSTASNRSLQAPVASWENIMDQLTLSERVARLENILVETGVAGDRNSAAQAQDAEFKRHFFKHEIERHFEQAQPSPKQADQTAFEEIIARISSCNDRVCLTADKLQKIGDRIMGELPNTCSGSDMCGAEKIPDGTLDHTFMALNWLDASLSRLEQVALRMERV
jgi:hypothetical protein